jgi:hypothetical protein
MLRSSVFRFFLLFTYWTFKKKLLTKYVPSAAKLKTIEFSLHISYGSYDTQQFLPRSEKQSISRTAGSKILNVVQINFRLQKEKNR